MCVKGSTELNPAIISFRSRVQQSTAYDWTPSLRFAAGGSTMPGTVGAEKTRGFVVTAALYEIWPREYAAGG